MYDFFLSHSKEEKTSIAIPLTLALRSYGFNVFLDRSEIYINNEIFFTIEQAIENSDFFIAIISKSYLEKHWPLYELYLCLHSEKMKRNILPVVFNVSSNELYEAVPLMNNQAFEKIDSLPIGESRLSTVTDRILSCYAKNKRLKELDIASILNKLKKNYHAPLIPTLIKLVETCAYPSNDLRYNMISYCNVILYVYAWMGKESTTIHQLVCYKNYAKHLQNKCLEFDYRNFDSNHCAENIAITALLFVLQRLNSL